MSEPIEYNCRQPQRLEDTCSFQENEAETRNLWAGGFRAIHAHEVQRGMIVAYVRVFFGNRFGELETAKVMDVYNDERGSIFITHGDETTQADECSEVWAKMGGE